MTTVDGRHRPASSDGCPACVGLLSAINRIHCPHSSKCAAKRRADDFLKRRLPKFLAYFEVVLGGLRRIIAIETDLFAIQAEILRDRRNEVTTLHGELPD